MKNDGFLRLFLVAFVLVSLKVFSAEQFSGEINPVVSVDTRSNSGGELLSTLRRVAKGINEKAKHEK